MRKTLTITLAALALLAGCKCANAATSFYTGNDLRSDLLSPEPMKASFAMGFVYGVWQGFETGQLLGGKPLYCTPNGAELSQVLEATKRQLAQDYAKRQEEAATFVVVALVKMWPCKAPAKSRNDNL